MSDFPQQVVSRKLCFQARLAVEMFVRALGQSDRAIGFQLLADISASDIYESAVTVIIRLVFLLFAEHRGLIPSHSCTGHDLNDSILSITNDIRSNAVENGESVLEQQFDAWPRLLSAFRCVYAGSEIDGHQTSAYAGRLFDPDRFPFLEGRNPDKLWSPPEVMRIQINNRVVLHLLELLQFVEMKEPGKSKKITHRICYKSLEIEQIGHVYESLLDSTVKRASEHTLGLIGSGGISIEIPLSELERRRSQGMPSFIKFLHKATGRTENTIRKLLKITLESSTLSQFQMVCGDDELLWNRIRPYAGLVQCDRLNHPCVILKNSIFVTSGTSRKATGTHYTPSRYTELLVEHTLERLVYDGPAAGLPRNDWQLKSPQELLDLKICDPACGSGAFLIQIVRYISDRLIQAWDHEIKSINHEKFISHIPADIPERIVHAKRLVVKRCLYGVDQDPMAVEITKLSLWLIATDTSRSFDFLDHRIRCGDSLLGIVAVDQLKRFHLDESGRRNLMIGQCVDTTLNHTSLDRTQYSEIFSENNVADKSLISQADALLEPLRLSADILIAFERDKRDAARSGAVSENMDRVLKYLESDDISFLHQDMESQSHSQLNTVMNGHTPFHWPLEFPEVLVTGQGFDSILINPPFIDGGVISDSLRILFSRMYQSIQIDGDKTPSASAKLSLISLFIERILQLTKPGATSGIICPKPFLRNERYWRPRQMMLNDATPITILDLPHDAFASASVETCGIVLEKKPHQPAISHINVISLNDPSQLPTTHEVPLGVILSDHRFTIRIEQNSTGFLLLERLKQSCATISDYFESRDGVNPGRKDFRSILIGEKRGRFFVPDASLQSFIPDTMRQNLGHSDLLSSPEVFDENRHKKTISGRAFSEFSKIEWQQKYLRYGPDIASIPDYFVKKTRWSAQLRSPLHFDRPIKVVSRQTAGTLIATIDSDSFFPLNNVHVHYPKDENGTYCCYSLTGILNSSLMRYLYATKSEETGKVFPQVHISAIRDLPIPRHPQPAIIEELVASVQEAIVFGINPERREHLDRIVFELYALTESEMNDVL